MNISELSYEDMNIILDNFGRICPNCEIRMQPLSTLCRSCGVRTPFKKINEDNYAEHIDMAKCKKHQSNFHYCQHPKEHSEIEDLKQVCIHCIIEYLAKHDTEVIKSTPKGEAVSNLKE